MKKNYTKQWGTFERKLKSSETVFYYRIKQENGKVRSFSTPILVPKKGAPKYEFSSAKNAVRLLAEKTLEEMGIKKEDEKNPLFLDFIKQFWIDREKDLSLTRGYLFTMQNAIRLHFETCPILEGVRLNHLKAHHIASWQAWAQESLCGTRPRGKRALNQALGAAKLAINDAIRKGLLDTSPLDRCEMIKTKKRAFDTFTPMEIKKLWNVNEENPFIRLAILIGLSTGARLGEILALRFDDFDFQEKTIRIDESRSTHDGIKAPKTEAGKRIVWLDDRLIPIESQVLQYIPNEPANFIFVKSPANVETLLPLATLKKGFFRMLNAIGISKESARKRGLHFHMMRHTVVSLALDAGVPFGHVESAIGHRPPEANRSVTLAVYNHSSRLYRPRDARADLEKINAYIENYDRLELVKEG